MEAGKLRGINESNLSVTLDLARQKLRDMLPFAESKLPLSTRRFMILRRHSGLWQWFPIQDYDEARV